MAEGEQLLDGFPVIAILTPAATTPRGVQRRGHEV